VWIFFFFKRYHSHESVGLGIFGVVVLCELTAYKIHLRKLVSVLDATPDVPMVPVKRLASFREQFYILHTLAPESGREAA